MRQPAIKNRKGFTLIELLVAMAVLSIGLMAMLDGLANYMRINIENQMRNEAMRIAETTLETLRNTKFADLQEEPNGQPVSVPTEQRRFRNIAINYTVEWRKQDIPTSSVAIQVSVTWNHRNIQHHHEAVSIVSADS